MKKITVLHIVLIVLAVLALTSVAANGGRKFTTTLTGAAEVPGPGDPDGTGTAKITLNHGQGTVCWEITVSGIDTATRAHIHKGPVGVAGPIVVPILEPGIGSLSGCTEVDRDLIKDIIQHPEEYYVNVHNSAFAAGAVRGQLSK